MKLLLKLQRAPQILQPNDRICELGNILLHDELLAAAAYAEHADKSGPFRICLHVLHKLLLPVAHHAVHDLEVPSLLIVKTGTTRAITRVKEVVNAIGMLPVKHPNEKIQDLQFLNTLLSLDPSYRIYIS